MNHEIFEMKTFWSGRDCKVMISCLNLHSSHHLDVRSQIYAADFPIRMDLRYWNKTFEFENDNCDDR